MGLNVRCVENEIYFAAVGIQVLAVCVDVSFEITGTGTRQTS